MRNSKVFETNNWSFYQNILQKMWRRNSPQIFFKVGLLPSKKIYVICFIESPLRMMKNAFYFILKALIVLKIFKFLSWSFGHVEKTAWLER